MGAQKSLWEALASEWQAHPFLWTCPFSLQKRENHRGFETLMSHGGSWSCGGVMWLGDSSILFRAQHMGDIPHCHLCQAGSLQASCSPEQCCPVEILSAFNSDSQDEAFEKYTVGGNHQILSFLLLFLVKRLRQKCQKEVSFKRSVTTLSVSFQTGQSWCWQNNSALL